MGNISEEIPRKSTKILSVRHPSLLRYNHRKLILILFLLYLIRYPQGPDEIKADTRITFDQVDEDIILNCRAAQKSDQGKYAVTLKNNLGSDTAHVNVVVLGKCRARGYVEEKKVTHRVHELLARNLRNF